MNTPNCINKKELLPEIPIKNKPMNNIGLRILNKIRKNLNEEFSYMDNSYNSDYSDYPNNYKIGKIFPEVGISYPLTPKKKNISRLNLSHSELDNIRTKLFVEDNHIPITPYYDYKNIQIMPLAPIKKSKKSKKSKNDSNFILDDIEDYIYDDEDNLSIEDEHNFKNIKRELIF